MKGSKHPASVCARSSGWNGASSAQLRACSAVWAGSLQLAPNEPHQTNKQRKRLHKLVPKTSAGWFLWLCAVPTSFWPLGVRGACPNITPQSVGQLHSPFFHPSFILFWGLYCKTAVAGDEPPDSLENILRCPHHWWQWAVQILCTVVVSCSWVVRRLQFRGHCQEEEHSPPKWASRASSHFLVFHWLIEEQLCPACLPEVFFFLLIQPLMSEIKCYNFST